MAIHELSANFSSFFGNLNPSATKITAAAREHARIVELIEDRSGPASVLAPRCFLQGSYKQDTAIHDINDVDVVALCELWQPGSGSGNTSWSRDQIFAAIANAIQREARYARAIAYGPTSMCVKVSAGVQVEVLPAVYASGNNDPQKEPFRLYRPESAQWADGFARYHQGWLTWKNAKGQADGNFIPLVKVLKHLRTRFALKAVSFHIECLAFSLPHTALRGSPADVIASVLAQIATTPAATWYQQIVKTPCEDRDIFTAGEWAADSWFKFHETVVQCANVAYQAVTTHDRAAAIRAWQLILGDEYFPTL